MREPGLYVLMSAPPGPDSEFVEVEDENGHGVSIPWRQEGAFWVLGPFAPAEDTVKP